MSLISTRQVLDPAYLSDILQINGADTIRRVDITNINETNTALAIKACAYTSEAGREQTRRLFIKTSKPESTENAYQEMSLKEGAFYALIKENSAIPLPVPRCYDVYVSKETGEFVYVLEDLSEQYRAPVPADLSAHSTWLACAESLARFHAAFWNAPFIGTGETAVSGEENQSALHTFLRQFHTFFDDETVNTFTHAFSINEKLIMEQRARIINRQNVTLCNGDSHIYNFLLPLHNADNPVMVDFQFWGGGYGTGDLAHLTRVAFPELFKRDLQMRLLRHYYDALIKNGVSSLGYTWENCLQDYRKAVAAMVLIPMWQYTGFGLPYEDWRGDVQGLVGNYMFMECDTVL